MIELAKTHRLLDTPHRSLLYEHSDNKLIVFERAGLLFAFNFHPVSSYSDYRFEAPAGTYRMLLDSDAPQYGGHNRLTADQQHLSLPGKDDQQEKNFLSLYLPSRTAIVFQHLI
jgi:1,4-alpha-glucan branching enzyme